MPDLEAPSLSQFKVPQAHLSNELTSFCSEHGLLSYIPVAIELIERCFPPLQDLHLLHEQDPETDEEWLVLDITLPGDEKQVLEAYDRYTDGWVAAVPWAVQQKVRLSYNIV